MTCIFIIVSPSCKAMLNLTLSLQAYISSFLLNQDISGEFFRACVPKSVFVKKYKGHIMVLQKYNIQKTISLVFSTYVCFLGHHAKLH